MVNMVTHANSLRFWGLVVEDFFFSIKPKCQYLLLKI